jgi:uncharacterized Zn finger protein
MSTQWYIEEVDRLILSLATDQDLDAGLEDRQRGRVMDLILSSGRLSSKFRHQAGVSTQLDIVFPVFTDKEWKCVIEVFCSKALYVACLLAGELAEQLNEEFSQRGIELVSQMSEKVAVVSTGTPEQTTRHLSALYWDLRDRVKADPFSLLTLRGRGRQETLSDIRLSRANQVGRDEIVGDAPFRQNTPEDLQPQYDTTGDTPERFWKAGSQIFTLSYRIKADELPAALLKRLDAPPVGTYQDHADEFLEPLYEYIACRAQAYGLGIP